MENGINQREKSVRAAYDAMQEHGLGFWSNGGQGFGDPKAKMTIVGPMRDGMVEAYGADADACLAVTKALRRLLGDKVEEIIKLWEKDHP